MPDKLWLEKATIEEAFTKAKLSDEAQAAVRSALGELNKAKGELDEAGFDAAAKALSGLLGFGVAKSVIEEAKKAATAIKESLKKAVGHLDKDNPEVQKSLDILAELADVKPTRKSLDDLPDHLKAEFEAMRKSQEDADKRLEEMQKSLDDERGAALEREYITKAEQEMAHIPLAAEKLGKMLKSVAEHDAALAGELETLLKSAEGMLAQSLLFSDLGSAASTAGGGAWAKIEEMAKSLVQKSTDGLTLEKAITQICNENPDLYQQYEDSRRRQ